MQRKGESYLTPPLARNAFRVLTYSGASVLWLKKNPSFGIAGPQITFFFFEGAFLTLGARFFDPKK